MRHVRETMPGSGDSGTGRNQRPATSTPTPRPTTPFIPNRHHGLVPHPIYPHSPKPTEAHTSQTNPTGPATSTPRPTTPFIPNRHPGLVPHPIYPHSPKPTEAHTSQTNPTGPATSTPRPTTPFIPNRHPGLVPHPICLHSPICTQPTGTPRCPAPTRRPGLVSAPLMRSKRRPPRPKHPTFTQFHRSGLHFGRIHPQHRPICPHSPICTQPTDTPRCPAPNRHPGLASAPFMRSKRRPPRPNTPHSPNFTEVVCALGAHRTIGSTSKETQWMRIRSTPLRRTHTPPQVQTTLSAVDSLGVLSCASW